MTTLLDVQDVTVRFGGILALDGVSFHVDKGQITGLIGPNGAGKTTLFNCLSRLYTPSKGEILFEGSSLLGTKSHQIAGMGIGRTFQDLAMFSSMTVLNNVMVGAHCGMKSGWLPSALKLKSVKREEAEVTARAMELLEFLGIEALAHEAVEGLPFGTLKRVELARAMISQPKLLLLDEPAGGLNHEEVESLGELIKKIRDQWHLTVLLVEHHMSLVMQVSDAVVVLDFGRRIAHGPPSEVQKDPAVIEAYLGGH